MIPVAPADRIEGGANTDDANIHFGNKDKKSKALNELLEIVSSDDKPKSRLRKRKSKKTETEKISVDELAEKAAGRTTSHTMSCTSRTTSGRSAPFAAVSLSAHVG